MGVDQDGVVGAGDQGMMFGFATNETREYMPFPSRLAHALTQQIDSLRETKKLSWRGLATLAPWRLIWIAKSRAGPLVVSR